MLGRVDVHDLKLLRCARYQDEVSIKPALRSNSTPRYRLVQRAVAIIPEPSWFRMEASAALHQDTALGQRVPKVRCRTCAVTPVFDVQLSPLVPLVGASDWPLPA